MTRLDDPITSRVSVETHRFDDAVEFMTWLRPERPHWEGGYHNEWLFRGQACSEWDLVPSAWRITAARLYRPIIERLRSPRIHSIAFERFEPAFLPEHVSGGHGVEPSLGYEARLLIRRAECEAVRQFVHLADAVGLYLPDTPDWSDTTEESDLLHPLTWASILSMEFHAFAQHHGIPTSLLDWTTQSAYAAHFAAQANLLRRVEGGTDGPIAVWAVHRPLASNFGFGLIECRRHDHGLLRAQHGCFVYSPDDMFQRDGEEQRFRSFTEIADVKLGRQDAPKVFRRACLTSDQVPRLLGILQSNQITGATLRPSYDGVSQTLQELWRRGIGDWPPRQGMWPMPY